MAKKSNYQNLFHWLLFSRVHLEDNFFRNMSLELCSFIWAICLSSWLAYTLAWLVCATLCERILEHIYTRDTKIMVKSVYESLHNQ